MLAARAITLDLNMETDLDRAIVDQETVKLLEGLASAVRLAEGDVGDAAADRVGAIGKLDLLDVSNRLGKILLSRGKSPC